MPPKTTALAKHYAAAATPAATTKLASAKISRASRLDRLRDIGAGDDGQTPFCSIE
jgi:hypothetical protein